MLLEVSGEGLDYLRKLASISDPTDEDDILYLTGLKPSSAKTEQEALDEMVLSMYSISPEIPKDEYYLVGRLDDDSPEKDKMQRTIARLYEAELLVNPEEGVII